MNGIFQRNKPINFKIVDLTLTQVSIISNLDYEQAFEKIEGLKEKYEKYEKRLQIVMETKQREQFEIVEGLRDDVENDLYSDTSSITGQSVTTASSKGSRSTG